MNSMKQETGNTYTGVTGAYSYVDPHGLLQQVQYVADGAGFRVADSRLPVFNPDLPVAPVFAPEDLPVAPTYNPELPVAPVYTGVAPESVVDTPRLLRLRLLTLLLLKLPPPPLLRGRSVRLRLTLP